jgi:hypothetical protein
MPVDHQDNVLFGDMEYEGSLCAELSQLFDEQALVDLAVYARRVAGRQSKPDRIRAQDIFLA